MTKKELRDLLVERYIAVKNGFVDKENSEEETLKWVIEKLEKTE